MISCKKVVPAAVAAAVAAASTTASLLVVEGYYYVPSSPSSAFVTAPKSKRWQQGQQLITQEATTTVTGEEVSAILSSPIKNVRRRQPFRPLFMSPMSGDSSLNYAKVDQVTSEYIEENYSEKLPLPELAEEELEEECPLDTTPESLAYLLEEEIVHHVEELVLEEEHIQQEQGLLTVLDEHLYEEIVEEGETLPLEEFIEQTHVNVSDSIISSWEPDTAQMILEMMEEKNSDSEVDYAQRPFMVGIVGIPGSGKTTSCTLLAELLGQHKGTCVIPMDGYHYSLKELNQKFSDKADDAIYRRGAPDTFDPSSLQQNLNKVLTSTSKEINFPGFDHHIGDPVRNEHSFKRGQHEVVICEGIYLLHDQDGWDSIKDNFDFTIYIESDVDFCVDRLKIRNTCIPGYTVEEIHKRCDEVDRINAYTVEKSRQHADHIVVSAFGRPATELVEEVLLQDDMVVQQ